MKRLMVAGLAMALGAAFAGAGYALAEGPMDQLAWLAGSWAGEQDGLKMEEHWTPPAGNLMVGMHRDVSPAGKTSFEFLRIVKREDGISYISMPSGRGETAFKLIESTARKAVFENLQHDFPQRILYWRAEDGRLHARIEGSVNGKMQSEEWSWSRSTLTP